ncbi:hypothetical protein A0H81_14980 [Grifola frondosa]|uniref:Uncharacterized protein n=1 Tax=Grifola frondosa TaxID=5627 RepID=A0A1C7LJV0_GRIFR|nr:hypothetical protein A0H81_14980 [Grifola frondosa]
MRTVVLLARDIVALNTNLLACTNGPGEDKTESVEPSLIGRQHHLRDASSFSSMGPTVSFLKFMTASKTLKDVLWEQAMLQARTWARDGCGREARGADDPAAALPVVHIRDAKRLDFALLEQNRGGRRRRCLP